MPRRAGYASLIIVIIVLVVTMPAAVIVVTLSVSAVTVNGRAVILGRVIWVIPGRVVVPRRRRNIRRRRCDDYDTWQPDPKADCPVVRMCR
jgi:hypothetical protein